MDNNRSRMRSAARPGSSNSWLKGQLARKPKPIWVLVTADILIFAVALLTFAYFHHVRPRDMEAVGITSSRSNISQTAPATTPDAVPDVAADVQNMQNAAAVQATPEPVVEVSQVPVGYFGDKFADKFTTGQVISEGNIYQSENVNITMSEHYDGGVRYYVADIYIRDIENLQTGFADDQYGRGHDEWPKDIAARLGGVLAINGDYYGLREDGIVIRNGVLYREDEMPLRDLCVLFWDGTMETYPSMVIDAKELMDQGAYQAWNFGPRLLDENGQAMENFNSDVNKINPRTAIGYYEPGHYCFVVVNGRSDDSPGLTMPDLSKLMKSLGCVRAYNLDGGQTSMMICGGRLVNDAYKGGRECSDAILIVDR